MTTKEQALYALMESRGYSYGLMLTAIHLLGQSNEALDEMIVFVVDRLPSFALPLYRFNRKQDEQDIES